MPHIILEYSPALEKEIDIPELLSDLHKALGQELGGVSRIKTRAIAVNHAVIGEFEVNKGYMAHLTLLLLEGRDNDTKKQYAEPLHKIAKDMITQKFPDCAITLEVRDMQKASYIL